MLFNSYAFILAYLPLTFLGFFALAWLCGQRAATGWLVAASFFFYGYWDWRYVPLLLASIACNYAIGGRIEAATDGRARRTWLVLGITANVLLLGYFKYTDFFLETANALLGTAIPLPHIVLPLGISFFTFTQSAYLVDAYRRQTKRRSFLIYCEFVTIFPHLIAGPIISHREMMPQFTARETFRPNARNILLGLMLFSLGLFKKVAIADALAPWAGSAFARADGLTFLEAWVGALSYTFQLYFDFSGYSEMALGLGLMFNLRLPLNFDSPYQARSIIDFWRRWHMTLGLWVRDYLYIPLGGNRCGERKKMRNLFLSMLIIGLWHGAGWTFLLWGALHGLLLMANHQWRRLGRAFPAGLGWALTFLGVTACWVFFRAASVHDALAVLAAMAGAHGVALPADGFYEQKFGFLASYGVSFIRWDMPSLARLLACLAGLGVLLAACPNPCRIIRRLDGQPRWLPPAAAALGLLFAVTLLLLGQGESEFLYFQF